tara:strand:+ start:2567 stop:2800 length:234 start_codon:yes stop_codon:yes gene_type:complete
VRRLALITAFCGASFALGEGQAQELSSSEVERGRYLTQAGDCKACHTDIENDGIPFAGGAGADDALWHDLFGQPHPR